MVMEVGLGGRLDASNTWDPQVAAITNVGLDHQEFLGDTIASVAAEKAAIIKPGALAVTGAEGEALAVIAERAAQVGVPLEVHEPLVVLGADRNGLRLEHARLGELRLPLLGRHQAANVAVALGILEALAVSDVATVADGAVRTGLANTRWPGRLEPIERDGLTVIVDGAHNPDGMAVLASTLDELAPSLPAGRATLLLGVMRDKEVEHMLTALAGSTLLREARCFTTVVPETERALPAADLAERWLGVGGTTARPVDDADRALEAAVAAARHDDGVLVIAGSLYLVGHLRARLVPGTIGDADA